MSRCTDAIRESWCTETSADGVWSPADRTPGQGAAAALVVQDYVGGELVRVVNDGESHYVNRLPDGTEIDLTCDQSDVEGPGEQEVCDRASVLSDPETVARYELLQGRVLWRLAQPGCAIGGSPAGPAMVRDPNFAWADPYGAAPHLARQSSLMDWRSPRHRKLRIAGVVAVIAMFAMPVVLPAAESDPGILSLASRWFDVDGSVAVPKALRPVRMDASTPVRHGGAPARVSACPAKERQ